MRGVRGELSASEAQSSFQVSEGDQSEVQEGRMLMLEEGTTADFKACVLANCWRSCRLGQTYAIRGLEGLWLVVEIQEWSFIQEPSLITLARLDKQRTFKSAEHTTLVLQEWEKRLENGSIIYVS
jgi:hypothetical protein